MTRKYQIAYGTLLLVAVLVLSVSLVPDQTYARYDNMVSWNAVVNQAESDLVIVSGSSILSEENGMLTITLPETPKSVEMTLKILSADQEYVECTGEAPFTSASEKNVYVFLGDNNVLAGTYQLVITWENATTETAETTETTETTEKTVETQTATVIFFVNYSGV